MEKKNKDNKIDSISLNHDADDDDRRFIKI